jgi:L-threonylcarbamoyladenylate synthase
MKEEIEKALAVLQKGGVIIYPTDTIWGIGCDATNAAAVQRIYEIKQREDEKSMLILVDTPNRLSSYVDEVPEMAWELVELATSPLTIIYPNAKNLAANLLAEDKSVGIRVVNDDFCKILISRFKKPVVSTSANISGEPAPSVFSEISVEILAKADYVVKWRHEEKKPAKPSGIIKLGLHGEVKVIRE